MRNDPIPRPGRATQPRRRDLVLVGGGHSHVQVLRSFAMDPPADARITVVLDRPVAAYSGMVPGFVAGQYRVDELEIDVVPLARRAGARVILAAATGIDARGQQIQLAGRVPIHYDIASIDIGSTVAGLDLPGVREHALPTRPIGHFVERVDEIVGRARASSRDRPFRLVVVGGGVGGVELAFTLKHRLELDAGPIVGPVLVHDGPRILPGWPEALATRVQRLAAEAGITIHCNEKVVAVHSDHLALAGGDTLGADAVAWVSGADSFPIFADSGLPTDERGFVLVRSTLQVQGHDNLFAAGDCATLVEHPDLAKAGVYAVREGPYLTRNLRALLEGDRLTLYRPQRDFLTLLNLGDGRAVGAKRSLTFEGRWVMRLKDWIDRRFMRRFQVLDRHGRSTAEFPAMNGDLDMLCGGCAAKVGQSVLERALCRLEIDEDASVVLGLDRPDDAAAVRTPSGDIRVSSVDAFTAFSDDPFIVGKIAAVNAVSDLIATGATATHALALVALPEDDTPESSEETLFQVLAGARDAFAPLRVTLVGGHTTTAAKLMVGFSVDGDAASEADLLSKNGLRPAQSLILTKPLGTGVLFHADMQGLAKGRWVQTALASMSRANVAAASVARQLGVTSVTDVTGFGLVGHLGEMLRASSVSAVVELASLPALPGAVELLAMGLRSSFHPENERARAGIVLDTRAPYHPNLGLLFDPQTSGGLLFGVDETEAERAVELLHEAGDSQAAVIGRVAARREDGALMEVRV